MTITKQVKNFNGEILNISLREDEHILGDSEKIMDWKNSLEMILKLNKVPFNISGQFGDGGAWCSHNPENREIGCGNMWFDNENLVPVMSVLHEIGHWYDETTNFDTGRNYFKVLGMLELETRAWEYAIDFGVLIGFDKWEQFKTFALFCLDTYFNKDHFNNVGFRDTIRGFKGTPPTWEEAVNRLERKISYVSQAQLGFVG